MTAYRVVGAISKSAILISMTVSFLMESITAKAHRVTRNTFIGAIGWMETNLVVASWNILMDRSSTASGGRIWRTERDSLRQPMETSGLVCGATVNLIRGSGNLKIEMITLFFYSGSSILFYSWLRLPASLCCLEWCFRCFAAFVRCSESSFLRRYLLVSWILAPPASVYSWLLS